MHAAIVVRVALVAALLGAWTMLTSISAGNFPVAELEYDFTDWV